MSKATSNFAYFSIPPVVWTRIGPIVGACAARCGVAALARLGITNTNNRSTVTGTWQTQAMLPFICLSTCMIHVLLGNANAAAPSSVQ